MTIFFKASSFAIAAAFALSAAAPAAYSQTAAAKPAAAKPARKGAVVPVKKVAELPPPEAASAEQIEAAERVYYGVYDCEFKQSVNIVASTKYPSYVDVKHDKADYLMKPVTSSTGAIRLEDVRGETLMVQIASKSMLLNVKTGHRVVDDCVSPKQRELIEAARAEKAAKLAAGDTATAPGVFSGGTGVTAASTTTAIVPPTK